MKDGKAIKSINLMAICNFKLKFTCNYLQCIPFSLPHSNTGLEPLNQKHIIRGVITYSQPGERQTKHS